MEPFDQHVTTSSLVAPHNFLIGRIQTPSPEVSAAQLNAVVANLPVFAAVHSRLSALEHELALVTGQAREACLSETLTQHSIYNNLLDLGADDEAFIALPSESDDNHENVRTGQYFDKGLNGDDSLNLFFDFNSATDDLPADIGTSVNENLALATSPIESSIHEPAVPSVVSTTGTRPRHGCHSCTKTFKRRGELARHSRQHDPNAHRYPCPFVGCDRVGNNGFLRSDKLIEHRRRKGH
ncbi:hypothetical protein B0O99DRAFT_621725 [Bisporella sp. PMI_857]|nr:hypothetical protein B0O99DRAFT_621725 [Bisporella sp. PMI_857]